MGLGGAQYNIHSVMRALGVVNLDTIGDTALCRQVIMTQPTRGWREIRAVQPLTDLGDHWLLLKLVRPGALCAVNTMGLELGPAAVQLQVGIGKAF